MGNGTMNPVLQMKENLPEKLGKLLIGTGPKPSIWMGPRDFRWSGRAWMSAVHGKKDWARVNADVVALKFGYAYAGWDIAPEPWFAPQCKECREQITWRMAPFVPQKTTAWLAKLLEFTQAKEGFLFGGASNFVIYGFDPGQRITCDFGLNEIQHTIAACPVLSKTSLTTLLDHMRKRNWQVLHPAADEDLALPYLQDGIPSISGTTRAQRTSAY